MSTSTAPSPRPISSAGGDMSNTLIDFAQPALDETNGDDAYRSALTLAVMAWNISLLPAEKRERVVESRLQPVLELYRERDRDTAKQVLEMLIQRKLDKFSAWPGFILGFELDQDMDPPSLTVTTSGRGPLQ